MSFWRADHQVVWQGVDVAPGIARTQSMSGHHLLDELLSEYADIFASPIGLPPQRRHDRQIHLLPGTATIAVRPYRYPHI